LLLKNYAGGVDVVPVLTGVLRYCWVAMTCWARLPGVVIATRWLGKVFRWRPLGWAGILGFRERTQVVHTLPTDMLCEGCIHAGRLAPVHNVRARFAGHSTLNLDAEYHFYQWLPFFWGQSPKEFDYWKELLRIGQVALQTIDQHPADDVSPEVVAARQALSTAEHALLGENWYWPEFPDFPGRERVCAGRKLKAYIEGKLQHVHVPAGMNLDDFERRVPAVMCRRFSEALLERDTETPREHVIRCLQPDVLLTVSICDVIAQELADRGRA
jgi:hypothetical protein